MIATVRTNEMRTALTAVSRAVSKRNTLPVMANIHAQVIDGRLHLYATDLEIGIRTIVDTVDVGREAPADQDPVTFPAADALAFVKSAPRDGVVTLVDWNDSLGIESVSSSVTLPTIDPDEFPTLDLDMSTAATIDGPTFARACQRAYVTAAKDETRPILTGALLRGNDAGLVIVTADNYRISESLLDWQGPALALETVVPARALKVWAQLARKVDRVAIDYRGHGSVLLSAGDITLASRTIDGQFPNYQAVMPTAYETAITFDTAAVASALAAVAPTAKRGTNVVRLGINGRLDISASLADGTSDATARADIVKSGDDLTIAFNALYLADALKAITGQGHASFNGPLSPMLLSGREDDTYRVVIMPVRLPA